MIEEKMIEEKTIEKLVCKMEEKTIKELVCKKVSLSKALKIKNRIVERLKEQLAIVNKYNVQTLKTGVDDQPVLVSTKIMTMVVESFANYQLLKKMLTGIKSVIAQANVKIVDVIISMVEAKSTVAELNAIPINIGTSVQSYGDNVFQSKSVIAEDERRTIVRGIEQKIDEWQEKIDKHNATTEVEISIDDDLITV